MQGKSTKTSLWFRKGAFGALADENYGALPEMAILKSNMGVAPGKVL